MIRFIFLSGVLTPQGDQNKQHGHNVSLEEFKGNSGGMSDHVTHSHDLKGFSNLSGASYNLSGSAYTASSVKTEDANLEHAHNIKQNHIVNQSDDGGAEARSKNYTIRIWKRTA